MEQKAIAEAKRYGEVKIVASSADKNFSYLPDCSDLDIPDNADYVYICENETINGTAYHTLPNTKGKVLVADQSSLFLSRPCDVSKYGLIWAGVQKNVGPAGMSIVIIREDLIREDLPEFVPTYLRYKTHADADSLYNTPNCWSIYCCGKVFQYLLANGGLEAMAQRNEEKGRRSVRFPGPEPILHRRCPEGGPLPDERSLLLPPPRSRMPRWRPPPRPPDLTI